MTRLAICALIAQVGCAKPVSQAPPNLPPAHVVEGVSAKVKRQFYDIDGRSRSGLRASLDQRGPFDEQGQRFDAKTRWTVKWAYNYDRTTIDCGISGLTTNVEVTYTLPRWVTAQTARPRLRQAWVRYLNALTLHEQGHAHYGLQTANAIQTVLVGLRAPTCAELERQADAAAERILEHMNDEEKTYDQATQHGRTQGGRFG
ncbi:MAG: DUF922 domain-containing protein [Myxococcota bacterium]